MRDVGRFVQDFSRLGIPSEITEIASRFAQARIREVSTNLYAAGNAYMENQARQAEAAIQNIASLGGATDATLTAVENSGPTKIASTSIPALDVNLRG